MKEIRGERREERGEMEEILKGGEEERERERKTRNVW